jgi:hypothetical protein
VRVRRAWSAETYCADIVNGVRAAAASTRDGARWTVLRQPDYQDETVKKSGPAVSPVTRRGA